MKRIPKATEIELNDAERRELETLSRSDKSEARLELRSRILLMAAEGAATRNQSAAGLRHRYSIQMAGSLGP
jgi:hypothetical protein